MQFLNYHIWAQICAIRGISFEWVLEVVIFCTSVSYLQFQLSCFARLIWFVDDVNKDAKNYVIAVTLSVSAWVYNVFGSDASICDIVSSRSWSYSSEGLESQFFFSNRIPTPLDWASSTRSLSSQSDQIYSGEPWTMFMLLIMCIL